MRPAAGRPSGRRSKRRQASTLAGSSRRRAIAPHARHHLMRAARPAYDARSARTADASDNGLRHPARYGQNDREIALGRKSWLFAGSERGADRAAVMATLIMTALCRARHKAVYAARRTMPSGSGSNSSFARNCGPSGGDRLSSIRHSLASYSASRKASRRSLGRKRVCLPRSYGLSFARAASLSARWACR